MINTMNQNKLILLSKKGLKELKKSISQLENDRRKALQSLREIDKTLGREDRLKRIEKLAELDNIETLLDDKRYLLSNSKLIPSKRTNLKVAIGSVVDLIDKYGHFYRFKIVNSIEANPSDGRISTQSPLGQSLLGKTVQDIVDWGHGKRNNYFQLVRIA